MYNPPCYVPDCEKCQMKESCKSYKPKDDKPAYIPYPYTPPTGDYWPIRYAATGVNR